ncbi:WD40-repeat-containing domain protein [Syncephalastrum racemosum]|uniref:WD40-repeat-containing domain protein n=1 Tax=Syncephalastrum racemosum TaxID=13706 RepID=A0A1X2HUE4_SYNRA|nr:WD40-repeat-containing domain protein [Syncephalastrum racemosum]
MHIVVLSGALDFRLKIWSVSDGSNPVTLTGHTSASSRDGTIRLWHCGTGTTIAILGHYDCAIHKIILTAIPTSLNLDPVETMDDREVETSDKLILAALADGTVRGIHLGTKQEIFKIDASKDDITAIAYDPVTTNILIGDMSGIVSVFDLSEMKRRLQWSRSDHAITSLLTKLNENGELVAAIAASDGSIHQTSALGSALEGGPLYLQAEYVGNDLEPIRAMKTIPNDRSNAGYERIVCGARNGMVKVY